MKIKQIIFPAFVFFFFVSTSIFAQTLVPGGTVSGVWTNAGSPYIVEGTITIADNDSLVIEPGVEVRFKPGSTSLRVFRGQKLIAIGTQDSMIHFTSDSANPAPGDWLHIYLNGNGYGSILKYCRVENSQNGVYCRAWVSGCQDGDNYSIIENCEFTNISNIGIWCEGDADTGSGCTIPRLGDCSPVIKGNKIFNNQKWGIYLAAWNGILANSFVGAEISNNVIFNNNSDGIRSFYDDPVFPKIFNNTIYGNGGYGIHFLNNPDTTYYTIENNIISSNNGGIYSENSTLPIIRYNDVWQNNNNDYFNFSPPQTDISVDPLFVDANSNDFSLNCLSECIDAGNPDSPYDPDGSIADIGAVWFDFSSIGCTTSNNSPICEGADLLLTADGGISYTWIGPNGFSSSDQNPVLSKVTADMAGDYSVTITTNDGCQAKFTNNVEVNPLPTAEIAGNYEFCAGSNTILSASGGTGYEWNTGDTTILITIGNAGEYSVTVTDDNGCMESATVMVESNPLPDAEISGGLSYCEGSLTMLTASGGTSFMWSTGETTASITAGNAGEYSVTVINDNGCMDSVTVMVESNPLPDAEISGELSFCEGSLTMLTASGGTSFMWNTGETTATITASSSGAYSVLVTDDNGCTNAATVMVETNPLPDAAISGTLSFCAGSNTELTAVGGTEYEWSTGENTASITASSAGDYSVTVTDVNGCTDSATEMVVSNPLPSVEISGTLTFCESSSTTLTASGGASFVWNTGEITATITVYVAGEYIVTVTDDNGCTDAESVSVTVNSLPVVTLMLPTDTFCLMESNIELMGGMPAGGTYSGPGVTNNVFEPSVAGVGTRTITYLFTDSNGCQNVDSQEITVVDCTSGISRIQDNISVLVFPNPSIGDFSVLFNGWTGRKQIQVFDARGRVVFSDSRETDRFEVSGLSSGIYFVQVSNGEYVDLKKIIVQ